MSRKAQGMSMNVIIIAALALLVLVILAIIFMGRMGSTTRGIEACKGNCMATEEECTNQGPYYKVVGDPCYISGTKDRDPDRQYCCVGV